VALPFEFGTKLTPDGKVPVKLKTDMGVVALVLTVKLLGVLTTKVALSTLVIAGPVLSTNKVKVWTASGATPLAAVMVKL
jgi:hypothetical protein